MDDSFSKHLGAAGLTALNESLRQLQRAVRAPAVPPATIAAALNVPTHAAWFRQLADAQQVERIDVKELVGMGRLQTSIDAIVEAGRPSPVPNFAFALANIPAFDGVSALLAATARPLTEGLSGFLQQHVSEAQSALFGIQRVQMGSVLRSLLDGLRLAYPPNWRGLEDNLDLELVDTLLLDEGLCLAWTPPNKVINRLFRAPNAAARREVLGRSWQSVTQDVIDQLDQLTDPALDSHRDFGLAAAEALLDGHHHAAQALSTNLLDTVLRTEFEQASYTEFTSQRENHAPRRLQLGSYTLRVGLVVGGIWGSHTHYKPGTTGAGIPRRFSRHASVHAVTRRQYSRRNSMVALMHATALLAALDSGDLDPE